MLSRVAHSLYWIGRYLERAENLSRLLLVTSEVSVEIEGLDDKLAQCQWDELLASVSSAGDPGLDFSRESGLLLPYFQWLFLDEANPISVRASKESAYKGLDLPLPAALTHTFHQQRIMSQSEDLIEGPRAFAEKRTPNWKGR